MAIEGEIMTIHQKIAEAHKRNKGQYGMGDDKPMRSFDAPKVSDIEEIKQVLQYILDKLHGMDSFMRTNMQAKHHRQYESDAQRAEKNAEKLGLASPQQCMNEIRKELKQHGNDSKEADSGTPKAPESIPGSRSCAPRQSDFRAGNTGNPTVEQKDSNNTGAKKVDG